MAPATVGTDRFNVSPALIGLLALGGGAVTDTLAELELEQPKLLVAVTLMVIEHGEAALNIIVCEPWPAVIVPFVIDHV